MMSMILDLLVAVFWSDIGPFLIAQFRPWPLPLAHPGRTHLGRSHYKTNSLSDLGHFEVVCLSDLEGQRAREIFFSSHDIGCIFSYKLRYFRQTCGAYMVNTDLLPAAPQIGILSSFFLVELPDSKSQLLEQILLSIMVFCLGGSHQSLKIFFLI